MFRKVPPDKASTDPTDVDCRTGCHEQIEITIVIVERFYTGPESVLELLELGVSERPPAGKERLGRLTCFDFGFPKRHKCAKANTKGGPRVGEANFAYKARWAVNQVQEGGHFPGHGHDRG